MVISKSDTAFRAILSVGGIKPNRRTTSKENKRLRITGIKQYSNLGYYTEEGYLQGLVVLLRHSLLLLG